MPYLSPVVTPCVYPLRTSLNNHFLSEHFNGGEQTAIVPVPLSNSKSVGSGEEWETEELASTTDRVFLLSADEVYDYIELLAGAQADCAEKRHSHDERYRYHHGIPYH